MKDLYIADSVGQKWHASAFLSVPLLMSMKDSEAQYTLEQMIQWESQFIEQEFEGINFPTLGAVESVDVAAEWVGYKQRTRTGQAKFMSRRATSFPKVSDGMRPFVSGIIPIGVGYDINYFQDQANRKFGFSADQQGLMSCAEEIDQTLELAWHYGGINDEDKIQVNGMFQYFNGGADAQIAAGTSLPKVALTTGETGNTWNLKTGNEILNDIEAGIAGVMLASKGKRSVKKIALGLRAWVEMSKKDVITEDGGNTRLVPYLQRTYPQIMWVVDTYFDNIVIVNSNETFNGGSSVFFYDDAPTNFKFRANRREIIRPYEQGKGFQIIVVNTFGLTAGIQMFNNYFGAYMKDVLAAP